MNNTNWNFDMKCPKCGLINPESAQICDCGFNFDIKSKDIGFESDDSYYKFRLKYLYIFLIGIILHMAFAGENTFLNYIVNTSSNPDERTLSGLLIGLYGTFAYTGTGMILSLLLFTPILYFISKRKKRNIFKSIAYAICIGVAFRILSFFI